MTRGTWVLRLYRDQKQGLWTSEQLLVCYVGRQKGKDISKQRTVRIVTVTGWCALDGNQRSLCLCWAHGLLCLCSAMCFLLSIVCPLTSCYQIIVSIAPTVSPSLPSFVSLFTLLVSVVLCWSVVFRPVCVMSDCVTVLCLPACFPPSWCFLFFLVSFYY